MNSFIDRKNEDFLKEKKKKYPSLLYRVLLSKLDTKQERFIIHIMRDDGKSLTANSYHVDIEYLADEGNWI